MDFEDSGIENDPKINNDTNTLKQNNEPIISFSPERCRFDTLTSNFRKPSTSFSVTDLQAEDPLEIQPLAKRTNPSSSSSSNANDCNSITNLKNSSTPTTTVPSNLPLAQGDYQCGLITHHHQNSHIFLQNDTPQLPSLSNLSSTPVGGSLVINTYSPTTTTLKSTSTTNSSGSSKPPVLATTTCVDGNPISLMINGSVLSANSTTNSTSDLQKRLEKRIAQASAAVATSSNSHPTGKTKASESILQNILSVSSSSSSIDGGAPNSNALIIPSSDSSVDNQISFSPQNTLKSHSAFQQKLPASLWESGSSASDIELLWESKLCSSQQNEDASKVIPDPFMETPKEIQVSQLQSEALAKEKENESNRDERNEIAKSTFISNNTCNSHHPITAPASTLNNIGAGDIFVSCSNNNDITPNVNKSSGESKSRANLRNNNNASNMTSVPPSAATSTATVVVVNTGFDIRKVAALLPPQRLAIPCKPNPQLQSSHSTACNAKTSDGRASSTNSPNTSETTNVAFSSRSSNPPGTNANNTNPSVANVHKTSSRKASISETSCNIRDGDGNVPCGNGNVKAGSNSSKLSSEKKPLVQWDSDESEEELSFFPPSKRGVITDNLSIDNMSLSGEEEDLHLTPPRPLAKRCPCDPRAWLDRRRISSSHHHHQHGDSIRNIVSKPCVIS